MTTSTSESAEPRDPYADVGRNDPCPCGSGRKFKKCCMKTRQAQEAAGSQSTRHVGEFIGPKTLPVEIVKLLRLIRRDNLFSLYHQIFHDQGPMYERYPSFEVLVEAINSGDERLVAEPRADFRAMRIDRPDIHILLNRTWKDPGQEKLLVDVVTLRPNEIDADGKPREVERRGWRVWDIQRFSLSKAGRDDHDVSFGDLELPWKPASADNDPRLRQRDAEPAAAQTQEDEEAQQPEEG